MTWRRVSEHVPNGGGEPLGNEGVGRCQALLLGLYVHLYAALHGRDLLEDARLRTTRRALRLSDDFASHAHAALRRVDPEAVLAGRSRIESVLHPTPETVAWATEAVHDARNEGRYIRRAVLSGLDPRAYEHPTDRKALDALEGTPGLETAVRKFWEHGLDRMFRIRSTGSNLRATPRAFPREHRALEAVCETLSLDPLPDLYIEQGSGVINAYTTGVQRPLVVLSAECISMLSYDELLFILGHEVGHIKSQHVLYHQMAEVLPVAGAILGSATLGFGSLLATGLELALLGWRRNSELTADRAGLLACQDLEAATMVLMKLAGLPPAYYRVADPADFIAQADEFEAFDESTADRAVKVLSAMYATHPWTVLRAKELGRWAEQGALEAIVAAHAPSHQVQRKGTRLAAGGGPGAGLPRRFCTNCGGPFSAEARFCTHCGTSQA